MATNAPEESAQATGLTQENDSPEHIPVKARDLTSRALHFLSNASNETLGACAVGLCAATWLVLGRVGLVLIGVVTGVVLHATWEGDGSQADEQGRANEARKRGEKGLDIIARVLDWRERNKGTHGQDDGGQSEVTAEPKKELGFSDFQPETRGALTALVDAIIRDYVKYVQTVIPWQQAQC